MAFLLLTENILAPSKPRNYPHRRSPGDFWRFWRVINPPHVLKIADKHRKVNVSEHCISIVIYLFVILERTF